jgi:gluconolactonase
MTREFFGRGSGPVSRRDLMKAVGVAGVAVFTPRIAAGQVRGLPVPPAPPPAPRDYTPGAPPVSYPDPDIVTLDPSFNGLRVNNTAIQRLWTGGMWCEGPAWSGVGRYLVWSDIPNNRQMRWIEDEGRVSVFRMPSNNSNGNTFDYQGRQISCEHAMRRVVRYEHDGSITVLADRFNGMRLNSPNDLAPHPDGSIWFTDPPFGGALYEGAPDPPGGPGNVAGRINSRVGQISGYGDTKRELTASNVYRVDPSGRIELAITQEQIGSAPNGIAFSPDHKKVHVVAQGVVVTFDVGSDNKVSNKNQLSDFMFDGVRCSTDGIRVDVNGNLWCGSNAGRNAGYSGVTVWSPEGKALGRIRLPEACANVAFGGPKRNRLFMTASQSIYAVYVNTQGASPG